MRRKKKELKTTIGKVWYFIWEDDSILSWVVNIILAIILIKFVVYPGLGLILGTQFPIVAVVSDSMEHENTAKTEKLQFDEWWQIHNEFYKSKNITHEEFREFPFHKGFNKGDLMVLVGSEPSKTREGDILVFMAGKPEPIIHRIVDIKNNSRSSVYETKGDNNQNQIKSFWLDEENVTQESVVGKAVLRIPYLGWVKITAVDLFFSVVNILR